jgi:2-polyprenyl-3-methyl-5-hydroxy-6-metoxy-1,4-benzoquinol methylase
MVDHSTCPLCSSVKIELQFTCKDHFVSGEVFPVSTCADCGFTFTSEHPDEESSGRYYESEDYISHSDTSGGLVNRLYKTARDFMLHRKTAIVKRFTGLQRGNLLDIGSGTGYFADAMKRSGWQATGVEISSKAREFSAKTFGIEVIVPSEISNLPAGSYDCITLWHVLEHFADPFSYMNDIAQLLRPDGRCIIALPNCSSFDAAHYQKFWAAWDVPRHVWHFTPDTFRMFAQKTGFEVIAIRTLPLDVFYISILSEKYRGTMLHFPVGLLKGAWFWIRSLVDNQRSSSMIYVLKRK